MAGKSKRKDTLDFRNAANLLEEHWQAVRTAAEAYEEARRRENAASSETTAALNALNAAQKLFDAAVAELKSIAPRGSDWKR